MFQLTVSIFQTKRRKISFRSSVSASPSERLRVPVRALESQFSAHQLHLVLCLDISGPLLRHLDAQLVPDQWQEGKGVETAADCDHHCIPRNVTQFGL